MRRRVDRPDKSSPWPAFALAVPHHAPVKNWLEESERLCSLKVFKPSIYSQVASIFVMTPINVSFSSAAATRSLSPNCLVTASSVLWVPRLILTSTRNLGGSACSRRTRTPRPMTVARLQWVMVGVTSTSTELMGDRDDVGGVM